MGHTILNLNGDGEEGALRRTTTWSAAPWMLPPAPPPLNLTHLRIVPPPSAAETGSEAPEPTSPESVEADPVGQSEPIAASVEAEAAAASDEAFRIRQLDLELAAARDEIEALHQMLEDLPEIFERKFRQRLQPVLENQQRVIAENQLLREKLLAIGPSTPMALPQLPPAREPERPRLSDRLLKLLHLKRLG